MTLQVRSTPNKGVCAIDREMSSIVDCIWDIISPLVEGWPRTGSKNLHSSLINWSWLHHKGCVWKRVVNVTIIIESEWWQSRWFLIQHSSPFLAAVCCLFYGASVEGSQRVCVGWWCLPVHLSLSSGLSPSLLLSTHHQQQQPPAHPSFTACISNLPCLQSACRPTRIRLYLHQQPPSTHSRPLWEVVP